GPAAAAARHGAEPHAPPPAVEFHQRAQGDARSLHADGSGGSLSRMRVALTREQEDLRDQLRAYFADVMTPEVEAAMSNGEAGGRPYRELTLKLGSDGLLGIGWPKEYGGQGRSGIQQFILLHEGDAAARA